MLSKPIKRSPSGASSYYYNTENKTNSLWGGKVSESLNLKDKVKIEQFNSVLNGMNPYTDEKLRQNANKKDATAAWDFTFSLSKNASILAFADRRIEKVFHQSISEALETAEERYAQTRTGKAGMNKERTQNLLYARFTHYNSRANDPQVHEHVLIINTTKSQDGKFRSLDNRELYSNYKLIGQIQEHILAQKIKSLGYEIDINRKTGIVDIRTNQDEIKQFFSKRSEAIKKEYEKNKDSFKYERDAKQKASWDTRQEKDKNYSYQDMKQIADRQLKQNFGISLNNLKKQALDLDIQESKNLSCEEKISLEKYLELSEELLSKETSVFTKEKLEEHLLKSTLGQNITIQDIDKAIDNHIRQSKLIELAYDKQSQMKYPKNNITTDIIKQKEKETIDMIKNNPKVDNFKSLSKEETERFIFASQLNKEITYTDGQK